GGDPLLPDAARERAEEESAPARIRSPGRCAPAGAPSAAAAGSAPVENIGLDRQGRDRFRREWILERARHEKPVGLQWQVWHDRGRRDTGGSFGAASRVRLLHAVLIVLHVFPCSGGDAGARPEFRPLRFSATQYPVVQTHGGRGDTPAGFLRAVQAGTGKTMGQGGAGTAGQDHGGGGENRGRAETPGVHGASVRAVSWPPEYQALLYLVN